MNDSEPRLQVAPGGDDRTHKLVVTLRPNTAKTKRSFCEAGDREKWD
jgi:hypothetical protein